MESRHACRTRKALARGGLILAATLVVLGGLANAAFAQSDSDADRGQLLAVRGRQLAAEGHCPEALADLERAHALRPRDGEIGLLLGQCRIANRDYVGAHSVLSDARSIDPNVTDLALYDGVALYHMGDYPEAWSALQGARGNVSPAGQADFELYTGLLRFERGEEREAALAFERARLANAAQVEPLASFYAGVAWRSLGEFKLARENFRRVIDIDGEDGQWGRRAEEMMAGEGLADRAWMHAVVGFEFDSNVALQSKGITGPGTISDQSDGRFVWAADGGAELFRTRNWAGGLAGSYSGSAHFDLTEFNLNYPVATAWLDRTLSTRSFLRGRYDIGYAWLKTDPYVLTQSASLGWHRNWGNWGNTEVAALWEWYGFKFDQDLLSPGDPAEAAQRDRSGQGVGAALRHRIDIGALRNDFVRRFELNSYYTYRHYMSDGNDWDYDWHDFGLGFETLLPCKLDFDVWGSVGYLPFDHVSSYSPDGTTDRRKDFIGQVGAELERPIGDIFSVSTRYMYLRNESNVADFDYSRHVVGAYLHARF